MGLLSTEEINRGRETVLQPVSSLGVHRSKDRLALSSTGRKKVTLRKSWTFWRIAAPVKRENGQCGNFGRAPRRRLISLSECSSLAAYVTTLR